MYILMMTQNYTFCRLQLVVETFGHSWAQIRKLYYKTLGASVINSPMSPPSLVDVCYQDILFPIIEQKSEFSTISIIPDLGR